MTRRVAKRRETVEEMVFRLLDALDRSDPGHAVKRTAPSLTRYLDSHPDSVMRGCGKKSLKKHAESWLGRRSRPVDPADLAPANSNSPGVGRG